MKLQLQGFWYLTLLTRPRSDPSLLEGQLLNPELHVLNLESSFFHLQEKKSETLRR